MKTMFAQVKHLKRLLLAAALLLAWPATGRCDPSAQDILQQTRIVQAGQHRTLQGHLRVQATGATVPFTLALDGNDIDYQFQDGTEIVLRLADKSSHLMEGKPNDLHGFSLANGNTPIKGTDLTYEDISLNFLYWPKAKIEGSEIVDGLNCWKLDLEPGDDQPSAYAKVLLWVSKRTGAFLQGEGYDSSGKLVKSFRVVSASPDPAGGWMLKEMRIQTFVPGAKTSTTYLEIDKG